ncbi:MULTISPECIES: ribonuclease HIII [Streptococcus]|uniref:Ribonuclease HIII n=1 Tax=Streptococcus caledonicus TaxID=2614158 RepID=A0ABW0UDS9_9STRE|nr:ribonuclease HIII [Streptococcus sp. S784/96/1]
MNTIVMKMGEGRTKSLAQELANYQIANNNPYVTFAAKVSGTTVLVYTSGKIVFQGSGAQNLAESFGYHLENSRAGIPAGQNLSLIGSDEVGNGSYFGGIAVVASLVTPADHAFLKSLGVDDSKNLTDLKIRQIAPILEDKIPHKALLLSPKKYNEVVGEGKKHNAVSVKVALHNQAIYLLLLEVAKPDKIVIDAFTNQINYEKYLKNEPNHFDNPLTFEEKAEGKYLAVAVSSIIARNLFLENLEKLGNDLGYKLPSGAGAKSDKVASQILATYGMQGLNYSAKQHFANTQKAQKLLK